MAATTLQTPSSSFFLKYSLFSKWVTNTKTKLKLKQTNLPFGRQNIQIYRKLYPLLEFTIHKNKPLCQSCLQIKLPGLSRCVGQNIIQLGKYLQIMFMHLPVIDFHTKQPLHCQLQYFLVRVSGTFICYLFPSLDILHQAEIGVWLHSYIQTLEPRLRQAELTSNSLGCSQVPTAHLGRK